MVNKGDGLLGRLGRVGGMPFEHPADHEGAKDVGDSQNKGQCSHGAGGVLFQSGVGLGGHGRDGQSYTGQRRAGYRGIARAVEHTALKNIRRCDDDDEVQHAEQQPLREHFEGVKQIDGGAELKAQEGQDDGVAAGKHLADIFIQVAQDHAQHKGDEQRDDLKHLSHTEAGCAEESQKSRGSRGMEQMSITPKLALSDLSPKG